MFRELTSEEMQLCEGGGRLDEAAEMERGSIGGRSVDFYEGAWTTSSLASVKVSAAGDSGDVSPATDFDVVEDENGRVRLVRMVDQ